MLKLAPSQQQDSPIAMTEVFVIRNQHGHYWGKSKAWVDGSHPRLVLRTRYRDEAVNTLFELSSKDIGLRGDVLAVELSERGEPVIEPSQNPLPMDTAADGAEQAGDQSGESPPNAGAAVPADTARSVEPTA